MSISPYPHTSFSFSYTNSKPFSKLDVKKLIEVLSPQYFCYLSTDPVTMHAPLSGQSVKLNTSKMKSTIVWQLFFHVSLHIDIKYVYNLHVRNKNRDDHKNVKSDQIYGGSSIKFGFTHFSISLCPLIPYMVINEVLQLIECIHAVWILSPASNLFFNGSLS